MDNITIRKMTISDLDEIDHIGFNNFDDFWSINTLRSELIKDDINTNYFIAIKYDEILGFIGTLKIIDELNIMNIAVRKDFRHLGVGSSLLSAVINYCNSENISTITLEVNTKNNFAINLYEKYGFKIIGLRKKYYNNIDDALIMSLYLK